MSDSKKKSGARGGKLRSIRGGDENPADEARSAGEAEQAEEELVSPENPMGFYEPYDARGRPQSGWGRFTAWAHGSKRWVYAIFLIAMVLAFWLAMRQSEPGSPKHLVDAYFSRFQGHSEDWRYEIADYYIPASHLTALYAVLVRHQFGPEDASEAFQNGELFDGFLRAQYNTDILVIAARQEGVLDSPEGKLFVENAVRNAVAEYYVQQAAPDEALGVQPVSEAEVREFYEANRETYERIGLDQTRALQAARMTLEQQRQSRANEERTLLRAQIVQQLKDRLGPRMRPDGE